jgi:hypothetical protein
MPARRAAPFKPDAWLPVRGTQHNIGMAIAHNVLFKTTNAATKRNSVCAFNLRRTTGLPVQITLQGDMQTLHQPNVQPPSNPSHAHNHH